MTKIEYFPPATGGGGGTPDDGSVTDAKIASPGLAESSIVNLTTDLAAKVPTTRTISAGTGLTGGGDLSANRTLAVAYGTSGTTAAVGNDARLSDTRTPTDASVTDAKIATTLSQSKIANLVADLAAKVVPLVPTATKTTDYTAVVNDLVVVDTTAGNVTVTLPASVAAGKIIGVRRADGSGNTLTVARSGSDVFIVGTGTTTSHSITLQDRIITFQSDGAGNWYLLNGYQSLASLDTRYTSTAQTLTNKRITKRIATLTDAATVTIDVDSYDGGKLLTLSQTTVFANPTGTPTPFQQYMLRVKSTSAQAISFGSQFRAGTDIAMPTTTTGSGKTDYFGFQYNSDDTKWDLVAAARGF